MADGGRIVGGLAILVAVVAGPLWLGAARGVKNEALSKASGRAACITPPEQMRREHPALLAGWRERTVRLGERVHRTSDGRDVRMSLTGTCLGCHGKAGGFCDRCHVQAAVTLSCWGCHAQSAKDAP
jgi:hypothetical protein